MSVIDLIDVLQRADTSLEQKHLQLGYHLVAFLDVLGQRDRFRELRIPKTADETAAVAEVLRQTAGFVTEQREIFAKQFVIFESALTKVQGPVRPKFVGLSDSFVSSVPLRNPAGDLAAVVSVFSALSAAAVVLLTALSAKHPLRGGIDVGLATEIAPQEIYGTALERAYLLESREAGSPRILIGHELWNYLEVALANFKMQTTPEAKSIVAVITKIMELITIDSDGKRVLDYLGQVMVAHAGPGSVIGKKMVKPAYEFVLSEEKRVDLAGNAKLVTRYKALRRYFESRLPLWNLKAENT